MIRDAKTGQDLATILAKRVERFGDKPFLVTDDGQRSAALLGHINVQRMADIRAESNPRSHGKSVIIDRRIENRER